MSNEKLSPKERATLVALLRMTKKNGVTPTQRELGMELGVTQTAVKFRLLALARKRFVLLLPRKSRGIVLLGNNE